MSRRRDVTKKPGRPDSKFNDRLIGRFVNTLMSRGKRSVAENMIYKSFDIVAERMKDDPIKVFKRALENIKPILETKSRRVGGATYQVPMEVRPHRREALGLRWMIGAATGRPGKTMAQRLADEMMDAYNKRGGAVKKREDVHRMAEANKAFAHYRW